LTSHDDFNYDFFICHANEDKPDFVAELAAELTRRHYRVWFDELSLTVGDSLRRSIDVGLASSRFGVVVLSPAFFEKQWAQAELDGLTQRQRAGAKVILPVWHGVERVDVARYSLTLADLLAVSSRDGVVGVADKLAQVAGSPPGSAASSPPELAHETVLLEAGPRFRGLLRAPNSTTWALVQVGAVPEGFDPITDDLHDAVERAFRDLEPRAICERQLDEVASWRFSPEGTYQDTWQGWVYQGPLAWMIMELPTDCPEGERWLDFGILARWWGNALRSGIDILRAAGVDTGVVGFAIYPYTSGAVGAGGITSLRLRGNPAAPRTARPHTIPPWQHESPTWPLDRLGDSFEAAAASLLKAFSYRHVDEAVTHVAALARASQATREPALVVVPGPGPATMRANEELAASTDPATALAQPLGPALTPRAPVSAFQTEVPQGAGLTRDHAIRFAPGGPVDVASRWIGAVWSRNDLREGWAYMDHPLRDALVRAWALANRAHPLLHDLSLEEIMASVNDDQDGPLWALFADTQLREFRTAWPDFDPGTWGVASAPRHVLPDYDLVLLVDTGGESALFDKPTAVTAAKLLMRQIDDRWLLAGFNETPA
jgi:hypothetical protein